MKPLITGMESSATGKPSASLLRESLWQESEEGTTTSSTREQEHPLFNEVILATIFKHFKGSHILTLRLVCKYWYFFTLEKIRRRYTFHCKFRGNGGLVTFRRDLESCSTLPTSIELDGEKTELNNLSTFPIRNFQLEYWRFREDFVDFDFWRSCGPWMHKLTLFKCKFNDGLSLKKILFEKTPNLKYFKMENVEFFTRPNYDVPLEPKEQPNLLALHIHTDVGFSDHWAPFNNRNFPMPWYYFVQHFPNLNEIRLRLGGMFMDECPRFTELLEAMLEIRRKDPSKLCIRILYILNLKRTRLDRISTHLVDLFQQAAFPLKAFSMDLGYQTEHHLIAQILQAHSQTLEKLVLYRGERGERFTNFPFGISFDLLTELKLIGPIIENILVLKYTPNLKSFSCVDAWQEKWKLCQFDGGWNLGFEKHYFIENTVKRSWLSHPLRYLTTFWCPKFRPGDFTKMTLLALWIPNLEKVCWQGKSESVPELVSLWELSLHKLKLVYEHRTEIEMTFPIEEGQEKVVTRFIT